MQYQNFRKKFEAVGIFSVNDVLKTENNFDRKQLVQWQKKGYIRKIINRWYCFPGMPANEETLFFIANKIYSPSYVSFESALSWHGLIPEGVYTITSASSLKTNEFKTSIGTFSYRHLKPELMFGYELISANNFQAKIAEPEKAILDFLYLNVKLNSSAEFSELRINTERFKKIIINKKMRSYLGLYKNNSLDKRANTFMEFVKNA